MLRTKLPFFLAYARANNQPIFIDYIENTAGAYINTGLKPSYDYIYKIKYQYTRLSDTFNPIFGMRTGAVPTGNGLFWTGMQWIDKQVYLRFGGNPVNYAMGDSALDIIELTASPDGIFINGEDTGASYFDGEITSTAKPMYLFTINGQYGASDGLGPTNAKVYSYQVFDGDMNLIQDLRPCLHPETFEACMYDTVTKQYFYNQGTGSFIPAPRFVEYIESDGNQYIDTGLIGNFNTKAEVKFATNSVSVYPAVFGAREAANSKAFNVWGKMSSGYIGANISNKGGISSSVVPSVGTQYTVLLSNNQLVVNDNTKTFTGVIDFTTPTTMLLFDINGGGTHTTTGSNRPLNGRVYYLKVWEGDTLIQHLRPCLRGNTPCMYDMVEGKYYMNAGTGTFGYGEIKFVEYIESTGTQYINLGYISPERAKTLRFVVDMSIDTNTGYRLCGSGYTKRQLYFGFTSSGTFAYGPGNVDAAVGPYGKLGIKYHYDYDVLNGSYVVSENGTIVASKQFAFSDGYTGANFYLFCYAGRDEVPTSLWSGKIYSFLVYENNTLVQDLRPALDYNNVACMYDMISGTYFYNQGTGEFIAGGKIV